MYTLECSPGNQHGTSRLHATVSESAPHRFCFRSENYSNERTGRYPSKRVIHFDKKLMRRPVWISNPELQWKFLFLIQISFETTDFCRCSIQSPSRATECFSPSHRTRLPQLQHIRVEWLKSFAQLLGRLHFFHPLSVQFLRVSSWLESIWSHFELLPAFCSSNGIEMCTPKGVDRIGQIL